MRDDGCAMCVIWGGYGREGKKHAGNTAKKKNELKKETAYRRHDRIKCWLYNKIFASMSLFTLYYYKFVDGNSSILNHKKNMKIRRFFSINGEMILTGY